MQFQRDFNPILTNFDFIFQNPAPARQLKVIESIFKVYKSDRKGLIFKGTHSMKIGHIYVERPEHQRVDMQYNDIDKCKNPSDFAQDHACSGLLALCQPSAHAHM